MHVRKHIIERNDAAQQTFAKGVNRGATAQAKPIDKNHPGLSCRGRLLNLKRGDRPMISQRKRRKGRSGPMKLFEGKPLPRTGGSIPPCRKAS